MALWIRAVSKTARTRPQKRLRGQRVETAQNGRRRGSSERDADAVIQVRGALRPVHRNAAPWLRRRSRKPIGRCCGPKSACARIRRVPISPVAFRRASVRLIGSTLATTRRRSIPRPLAAYHIAKPKSAIRCPACTHGVRCRYHQTKFLASGHPQKHWVRVTIRINISSSLMRRRCFPAAFGAVVPVKAASAGNLKRAICLLAGGGRAGGAGLRRG